LAGTVVLIVLTAPSCERKTEPVFAALLVAVNPAMTIAMIAGATTQGLGIAGVSPV
jgi:hypothetical protein